MCPRHGRQTSPDVPDPIPLTLLWHALSVDGKNAIKFCVGSREKGIFSYVWRLWWGGTSFYIKPTYSPIAQHK